MTAHFLLISLVVAGGGLQASPTELSAIQRVIHKEPAYRAAPKYSLLVFGKNAATRVWMVLDGNTLYIDRNGNGDLTEPGEKVTSPHGPYFTIDSLFERDGTVHRNLTVNSSNNETFNLRLGEEGRREQFVGIGRMDRPTWGTKPANAPIIHFNGPMTLERYGPVYTLPRTETPSDSRRYKLRLMVGTPGLGKGTFASYDEICSEKLGPIQADIEYRNPNPKGDPIKQRLDLFHDG